MPGLPSLPEELLELIFSHLTVSRDPLDGVIERHANPEDDNIGLGALAALCLVSKQCCRLARPLLFHTIHLFPGVAEVSYSLHKLVRTLIYQPVYARYVTKLCVDSVFLEDDGVEDDHWDLPYEEAVEASHAFDPEAEAREALLENLRWGTVGAHAALLLALCQDAQSVSITLPAGFHGSSSFADRLLSNVGGGSDPSVHSNSSVALSSVKMLSLNVSDNDAIPFADMINLFQLPRLEVFRGTCIDCTAENTQYECFTSNLSRLDLDECLIDAHGLKSILQACPRLRDLAIAWADSLLGDCELDFHSFGRQLGRYGKSLKRLSFDLTQTDFEYHESGGLGDISQMTSLETLAVPADLLVGRHAGTATTLPANLERLDVDASRYPPRVEFWRQLRSVAERGQSCSLATILYRMDWRREPDVYWSKTGGFTG